MGHGAAALPCLRGMQVSVLQLSVAVLQCAGYGYGQLQYVVQWYTRGAAPSKMLVNSRGDVRIGIAPSR